MSGGEQDLDGYLIRAESWWLRCRSRYFAVWGSYHDVGSGAPGRADQRENQAVAVDGHFVRIQVCGYDNRDGVPRSESGDGQPRGDRRNAVWPGQSRLGESSLSDGPRLFRNGGALGRIPGSPTNQRGALPLTRAILDDHRALNHAVRKQHRSCFIAPHHEAAHSEPLVLLDCPECGSHRRVRS